MQEVEQAPGSSSATPFRGNQLQRGQEPLVGFSEFGRAESGIGPVGRGPARCASGRGAGGEASARALLLPVTTSRTQRGWCWADPARTSSDRASRPVAGSVQKWKLKCSMGERDRGGGGGPRPSWYRARAMAS